MIILSEGQLSSLLSPTAQVLTSSSSEGLVLESGYSEFGEVYRRQSAVRFVVDFFAGHAARIPFKVMERTKTDGAGPDDRHWLSDHDVQRLLVQPNNFRAHTQFWRDCWLDFLIYDRLAIVKLRNPDTEKPWQLIRIPATWYTPDGGTPFRPAALKLNGSMSSLALPIEDCIYIHGYDPSNPLSGISPMETLSAVLQEEAAANAWRRRFWETGAQPGLIITRPVDAPDWDAPDRDAFIESLRAAQSRGRPLLLEEGMTSDPTKSFDPNSAAYHEGRQLTREEVVRAYQLPLGLFDPKAANFSSIAQYRAMLYEESLAPAVGRFADELQLQLLTEWFADPFSAGVSVEPMIYERVRGNIFEILGQLRNAAGRPILTAAEARDLAGLRTITNEEDATADSLILPSNVLTTESSAPKNPASTENGNNVGDTGATENFGNPAKADEIQTKELTQKEREAKLMKRSEWEAKHLQVLDAFFTRQASSVKSRAGAEHKNIFDAGRWDRELGEIFYKMGLAISDSFGSDQANALGIEYDLARTKNFWTANSKAAAKRINDNTRKQVLEGVDPGKVFEAITKKTSSWAAQRTTFAMNWGVLEAARQFKDQTGIE